MSLPGIFEAYLRFVLDGVNAKKLKGSLLTADVCAKALAGERGRLGRITSKTVVSRKRKNNGQKRWKNAMSQTLLFGDLHTFLPLIGKNFFFVVKLMRQLDRFYIFSTNKRRRFQTFSWMIHHHLLSNLATLCNESTAASSLSQYYSASRNGGRLEVFPDSPKWRVATTKIFINRLIFKLPSRKLPEYGKISHNFQWNYGCRANNSPFGGLKPDRHFSWRVRLAELEKFWYLSFNISIILTFFNDARAEFLTTRTAQLYSV